MKKILLFFAVLASSLFASCDDNRTDVIPQGTIPLTPNKFVLATINGTSHMFDETKVEKQQLTDSQGNPYTDLIVTANKKNDLTAKIIFRLEYMRTGPDTCYYFLYNIDDKEYDIETNDSFQVNVTYGEAQNIKGTFSGTLSDFEGNQVTISNGNFDIHF